MAPNYSLNHVTKDYPFMTCLVKVNTQSYNWQKTVSQVLNKCHGVYSFRMDGNGAVEISGTADPGLLLKMLGKAGRRAELRWFQFGDCSSNLFMPTNHRGGYDQSYVHNHDYDFHNHGYQHSYDYQYINPGFRQGGEDMGCCRVM